MTNDPEIDELEHVKNPSNEEVLQTINSSNLSRIIAIVVCLIMLFSSVSIIYINPINNIVIIGLLSVFLVIIGIIFLWRIFLFEITLTTEKIVYKGLIKAKTIKMENIIEIESEVTHWPRKSSNNMKWIAFELTDGSKEKLWMTTVSYTDAVRFYESLEKLLIPEGL